ncbi:MAG: hypothetical protein PHY16_04665 [Methylobacter sp.]|nr:hypothetical protein [Methylobacter sp.]
MSEYIIIIFLDRHSGMECRTNSPGADWHLPIGVRGRKARMNPGAMDEFKLAIPGAGYPLPGEYDALVHNLTK